LYLNIANLQKMSLETEINVAEQEEKDDLEDFFNKKNKKGKKKKKKKNVEIDMAAAETKLNSKNENSKPEGQTTEIVDENKNADDEEWNDYEEEVKDYSDLKVQNFQISETPVAVDEPEKEYNEAGELLETKPIEGPWNKTLSAPSEPEVVSTPTPPPEPVKTGAYRPPNMRSGEGGVFKKRTKKQQAPEINSVMDFPTLSAAAEDKEEKGFQVVKGGAKPTTSTMPTSNSATQPWRSRRQMQQEGSGSSLKMSNQFSALNSSHY